VFVLLHLIVFMQAKHIIFIVIIFTSSFVFAQADSIKVKRIGVIGTFDYAYNFQDKVLNPTMGLKCSVGISLTDKKRKYIVFIGGGLKPVKGNFYPTTFRQGFLQDVRQNYVPGKGNNEDSLIGSIMGSKNIPNLGTVSYYLQAGFILNNKFKPSVSFYYGNEQLTLHDDRLRYFEDPKYGDINYVDMKTTFYEVKLGCSLPFKNYAKKPYCINLNVGYKWVNYGALEFNNTPLSAYTVGALDKKYNSSGRLTISLSFALWSNW
jgi:hypothetical protein